MRDMARWARQLAFELGWWKDRDWLHAGSFSDLVKLARCDRFDVGQHRLKKTLISPQKEMAS